MIKLQTILNEVTGNSDEAFKEFFQQLKKKFSNISLRPNFAGRDQMYIDLDYYDKKGKQQSFISNLLHPALTQLGMVPDRTGGVFYTNPKTKLSIFLEWQEKEDEGETVSMKLVHNK